MQTHIIYNGIVINTIIASLDDAKIAFPEFICIDSSLGGSIGDFFDGHNFSSPVLPRTINEAIAGTHSALASEYEKRVQALAAGYSQYERESWPVQTAEATAYSADPLALTPWLDAACAARGIDKSELAARVIAMDTAYRQIHGALTGHRQKLWDQIAAAQTAEDIAAIDVTAGWPA